MPSINSNDARYLDITLPTYDALSYADFLKDHLTPNTPFLLSPEATKTWGARRDWASPPTAEDTAPLGNLSEEARTAVLADVDFPRPPHPLFPPISRPNFEGLEAYGDHVVPVADTVRREFSEFERSERPLREVLELWRNGEGRTLYVKDWHMVAEVQRRGGDAGGVYRPPDCFLDDWLSPPFDAPISGRETKASTADFRFVYAGPAGTFTPLHRDVYGSYSWSSNVIGRKLWWLFPPGREPRDKHGELRFDVRDTPEGAIKILQGEGEVIFVPSGWHHQVLNLDFCISINHNFFSSPTLPRVYKALRVSHNRCAESILDILPGIQDRLSDEVLPDGRMAWEAEWAEEVDRLLEMDAGWGWEGFWGCVRGNLENPPSPQDLRPGATDVERFVRSVIDEYKHSKEWLMLPGARKAVGHVEALLEHSGST